MDRRDRLAQILTDDDVATLKHLAREGMGENSLRALASDLAYLEAWAQAATGSPLPWPAPEALALKFVAHHLWDPAKRETDPAHGMPAAMVGARSSRRASCAATGRMRRRPSNGASPAGRPCIAGAESPGRSPRRPCMRRSAGRARQRPPAPAQKQTGGDPRHPRPPDRRVRL